MQNHQMGRFDFGLRPPRAATTIAVALVALSAGRLPASSHGPAADKHTEAASSENSDVKSSGIELGEFRIRADYPAEAQKSTVRFVIYAAVNGEEFDEMERLVKKHRRKVRDEIIIATRLTPLGVFEEPDLAAFRRRILIRLRRTLPELAVEGLYISDFGMIVKSL